MNENSERIGNFTSSQIHKLMKTGRGELGFGSPAIEYIQEKRMEIRMGRSLSVDSYSQPMYWGIFLEMYVFKKIGIEYRITSKTTDLHPSIKNWSGSKDLHVKGKKVADIKCYQPKNFGKYADMLIEQNKKQDLEVFKKEFPKEYWQLVSNAIINRVPNAEVILFMPLKSELKDVRKMAEDYDGLDPWKYRFIYESPDSALPYLPDGGYYDSMNTFEFEVPKSDIKLLTETVLRARKLLLKAA